MTTTVQHAPSANTTEVSRSLRRRAARLGGAFYLLPFAASIPAPFLLGPVLNDADYIVSSGADACITLGACLDVINLLACTATAVALFPVLKRHSETLALGLVTTRMFEAAVIAVGVLSLLTVVTLRQPGATGAEADSSVPTGTVAAPSAHHQGPS
jgi:hypothetical protein